MDEAMECVRNTNQVTSERRYDMATVEVEVQVMEQTALSWPARALAIKIIDQSTYNHASALIKEIRKMKSLVKEYHKPIKQKTDMAHKEAVATEKRALDPLDKADDIISEELSRWDVEQERLRKEAQAKADAEAKRLADLAATAEAKAAKANGATQEVVDAILTAPVPVPSPVVLPTFQKADGLSTRKTWAAELSDIKALCRAVAEGKASPEYVLPNMVALNKLASAMKTTFNIPGVRAVCYNSLTVRK